MMSNRGLLRAVTRIGSVAASIIVAGHVAAAGADDSEQAVFRNGTGHVRTVTEGGEPIDFENPFFQELGTNGRRCVTCHEPNQGWTITPEGVEAKFLADSADPIFRNNDGSNCEGALADTVEERREAYSLLLTRGLIRVGLDVSRDAEFAVDSVADPFACGQSTNDVSVYRRPLPATNLRFLTAVMWDGRESFSTSTIVEDLRRQANNATRGHAQGFVNITAVQAQQIVDFELQMYTAQSHDDGAAGLTGNGARGGPMPLVKQPFFVGINDPIGLNPTGVPFNSNAFTIFDAWSTLKGAKGPVDAGRAAVARGQAIFNTKPITLAGIGGLNGETFVNGVTLPETFVGTCTVCHDSPNVGNHSVKAPLDIGLTAPDVGPYLPVYTLRHKVTGDTIETTDPGLALITGKWRDVNRFKGPILRGLSARAPYFHNGSAATLREAVEFYDTRFDIGLTPQEKADLEAFLRAL
jgi:hypothetical protein